MNVKEWHDFLYTLGLCGQIWLHVNRVGGAYLRWRTEGIPHYEWGEITESKLLELLALSRPGLNAEPHTLSEQDRRLVVKVLHHVISDYVKEGGTLAN